MNVVTLTTSTRIAVTTNAEEVLVITIGPHNTYEVYADYSDGINIPTRRRLLLITQVVQVGQPFIYDDFEGRHQNNVEHVWELLV